LMKIYFARQLLSNTATLVSIGLKNAEALSSTGQAAAETANTAAKTAGIAANQGFMASAIAAAPAVATLGIALLKAGLGALAFGAGILLAAAGIYLIIKGMIEMVSLLIQNIGLLPQLTLYTGMFALSLYGLAASFLSVAGTGVLLIAAFAAMALALIPLTIIIGVELGAIGLASLLAAFGVGLLASQVRKVADSISEVSASIKDMQDVGGIEKFITVVEQIEEADVDNLTEIMDQADRYVKVQTSLGNIQLAETLSDGISKLTSLVFGDKDSKSGKNQDKQVINLKLREDTFATAVVKAVRDGDLLRME